MDFRLRGNEKSLILTVRLLAELFFLVLDEPADHLPPQGLGQLRRQPLLHRPRPHPVDHLLDPPRYPRFRRRLFELPGAIDIGEALADEVDQRNIDAVDLRPHLFHVGAVFWLAQRHQTILRRMSLVGRIVMLPCSTSLAAWPSARPPLRWPARCGTASLRRRDGRSAASQAACLPTTGQPAPTCPATQPYSPSP